MPSIKTRVAIWIAGFLTFMAGLNSIYAIILWSKGNQTISPYLISQLIGEIPITAYFWLSITSTFVFLGLATTVAYRTPPVESALLSTSAKLEENIAKFRKDILAFLKSLSEERGEQTLAVEEVNKTTKALKKNLSESLEENRKVREELLEKIGTTLGNAQEALLKIIETQGASIRKVEQMTEESARALESSAKELAEIKMRMEKMEAKLTPEPPRLTSKSSVEEIKGVGPRIANELKMLGITSVMDLVTADPIFVMKKTGSISSEKVAQWQAIAQLQMIPGISEGAAELLEKAGVRSRKELADQDPVGLSRKIEEVIRNQDTYGKVSKVEKPTIEEVAYWIKMAKL
jgi:predicted flap endonuclease-1-like 5' DNA nuclease